MIKMIKIHKGGNTMKKRNLKLLSLTLVVLLTFFAVGCDMDAIFAPLTEIQPDVPSVEWDSTDDTTLVTDDRTETNVFDDEPSFAFPIPNDELDFEGEELIVLVPNIREPSLSWNPSAEDSILSEYVLIKNAAVSEKFNVEINFEFVHYPDSDIGKQNFSNIIIDDVMQDLHYYDIVTAPSYVLTDAAVIDYLANVGDYELFPYFEFELPCWNQSLIKECKVNDRLYLLSGANEYSTLLDSYVVWHNKTLYDEKKEDTDHEGMMYLALDGHWTYDELYRWSARLYEDSNGVVGQQIDDTYALGIIGSGGYPCADAFRGAWEAQLTLNVDGEYFKINDLTNNQRVEEAAERVKTLYKNALGTCVNADRNEFMAGHYMFAIDTLGALKGANASEDVIEILPMPKFDYDQEHYKTISANPIVTAALNHNESTIPTKSEAISAVLELCNEEMYNGIFLNLDEQLPIEINDEEMWVLKNTFSNTQMRLEDIYSPQLNNLGDIFEVAIGSNQNVSALYLSHEQNFNDAVNKLNEWFGNKG